jgi:hypothetical protein
MQKHTKQHNKGKVNNGDGDSDDQRHQLAIDAKQGSKVKAAASSMHAYGKWCCCTRVYGYMLTPLCNINLPATCFCNILQATGEWCLPFGLPLRASSCCGPTCRLLAQSAHDPRHGCYTCNLDCLEDARQGSDAADQGVAANTSHSASTARVSTSSSLLTTEQGERTLRIGSVDPGARRLPACKTSWNCALSCQAATSLNLKRLLDLRKRCRNRQVQRCHQSSSFGLPPWLVTLAKATAVGAAKPHIQGPNLKNTYYFYTSPSNGEMSCRYLCVRDDHHHKV